MEKKVRWVYFVDIHKFLNIQIIELESRYIPKKKTGLKQDLKLFNLKTKKNVPRGTFEAKESKTED